MKKNNYIFNSIDKENIQTISKLKKKHIPIRERRRRNKIKKAERKYKRVPKQYKVYIKSKYWTNRKNRYYQDYGKKCFICGACKYIQLHHLEYNSKTFGFEEDKTLVQLCIEHHQEFHARYGVKRKMYKEFDEFIDIKYSETIWQT